MLKKIRNQKPIKDDNGQFSVPYTVHKKPCKVSSFVDDGSEDIHLNDPHLKCKICGKDIHYLSEVFASSDGEGVVHFDCALSEAKKSLRPETGEIVSYVGGGKFAKIKVLHSGVVYDEKIRRTKRVFDFKILEECTFETKENNALVQEVVQKNKR